MLRVLCEVVICLNYLAEMRYNFMLLAMVIIVVDNYDIKLFKVMKLIIMFDWMFYIFSPLLELQIELFKYFNFFQNSNYLKVK